MITEFIYAIPQAASSPIALIVYLSVLIVWGILLFRIKTLSSLNSTIMHLPETDRIKTIQVMLGEVDVKKFTALEYIKLRRSKYIFYAFLTFCAMVIILSALTLRESLDKEKLTDDLIDRAINPPTSQYMSSYNTIYNGPSEIYSVAKTITSQPDILDSNLDMLVDRMRQEGKDLDQIKMELKMRSGGGQLQSLNQKLLLAANRINEYYTNLAECFLQQRCVKSSKKMKYLCGQTKVIESNIRKINTIANNIPGITINYTEGPLMFGNGIMDIYFDEIKCQNILELNKYCS